jgi:hypothetical protein
MGMPNMAAVEAISTGAVVAMGATAAEMGVTVEAGMARAAAKAGMDDREESSPPDPLSLRGEGEAERPPRRVERGSYGAPGGQWFSEESGLDGAGPIGSHGVPAAVAAGVGAATWMLRSSNWVSVTTERPVSRKVTRT